MPKVANNSVVKEIGTPVPRGARRSDKPQAGEPFERVLRQNRPKPQPQNDREAANISSGKPVEPKHDSSAGIGESDSDSPSPVDQQAPENAEATPQEAEPAVQAQAQTDAASASAPPEPQAGHEHVVSDASASATQQTEAVAAVIWGATVAPPPAAPVGEPTQQPQQDDGSPEIAGPLPPDRIVAAVASESQVVAVAMTEPQEAQGSGESASDSPPPRAAMKLATQHVAAASSAAAPDESPDAQQTGGNAQRLPANVQPSQDEAPQLQPAAEADSQPPTEGNQNSVRVEAAMNASRTLEAADRAVPTGMVEASSTGHNSRPIQPQSLPSSAPQAPVRPEAELVAANHDRIVTSIRGELMPNGGTMRLRLDPPELGTLQVTVRMLDGVMSASFETSNDQATRLLSHSLGQLKQVLESQGLSVEKLHVQQSPREQSGSSSGDDPQHQQPSHEDRQWARQEQQRREMLRRMWRRLGLAGTDPLDLVA
jgi:flagellar hook-length control protein FliK